MKVVSKYLEFKNTIEEVEGIGKAVFSRDSNNLIWHEVATKINNLLNIRTSVFVMILNNQIVQIEKDPSLISPCDKSNIVEIENIDNLKVGEYVYISNLDIVKINPPDDMVNPVFNEKTHIWVETATQEELQEKYYSIINDSKAEILENGYLFIDNLEGKHQQKCRDKDLALLGNCIAAHEDASTFSPEGELKILWAFNDGDTLEMNLTELKKLRLQGAMFVQAVFNIESQLKAQESNVKFTKNDFIELINSNSDIKCWE